MALAGVGVSLIPAVAAASSDPAEILSSATESAHPAWPFEIPANAPPVGRTLSSEAGDEMTPFTALDRPWWLAESPSPDVAMRNFPGGMIRPVNLTTAFGGPAPAPMLLGVFYGQKVVAGNIKIIGCEVILGADSPGAAYGDARPLKWGITTQCNHPAISGVANSTLGGVNHPDNTVELRYLHGPVPQINVRGNYGDFGEGVGHAPIQFSYTETHYQRYFDRQQEQVYGFLDLTIDGVDGQDGWYVPAASGSITCDTGLKLRIRCAFNTIPFESIPAASADCQAGSDTCRLIAGNVAFLADQAMDIANGYSIDPNDGEPSDEDDTDEIPAVLTPDIAVGATIQAAKGSKWKISVPGHELDASFEWVTMRRAPSSFVIGSARHEQRFFKSASRYNPKKDTFTHHYGRVYHGYDFCGWMRAGTVGENSVTPTTPSCSTDPRIRMEVREFASLVSCDPRRNRNLPPGAVPPCRAGETVRLSCTVNQRFQNVKPWLTGAVATDELQAIGNQDVLWRYVTKDGRHVLVQLNRNVYSGAQGRYTFVKRGCLPATLPGDTWVPVAGV